MIRKRTRTNKGLVTSIKAHSEKKVQEDHQSGYVPTGCSLLNLALSDKASGGFGLGKMTNIIGDRQSGKSLLALSLLAECAHSPAFDDYKLIYDDVEQACEFDIEKLFGRTTKERVEPPEYEDEIPLYSCTVQDFHANVVRHLKEGRPFIYILDSLDALDAEEDQKKADEMIKARETGREISGTYGMAKPKAMSWILRHVVSGIKKTKSALIIISQTRDNISPISFAKKTRSGGRALEFYCTHELWLAVSKTIKKKDLPIGVFAKIKVTKNKLTGKSRQIEIPLYYSYGLDDIGASVNWLVQVGHWKKKGNKIDATELGLLAGQRRLIGEIESKDYMKELSSVVAKVWEERESSLSLDRKPKYC